MDVDLRMSVYTIVDVIVDHRMSVYTTADVDVDFRMSVCIRHVDLRMSVFTSQLMWMWILECLCVYHS